jgi:hypothetical protein
LGRPILGDACFGCVAELREEVSPAFKLGDGLRVLIALDEAVSALKKLLRLRQPRGLVGGDARVETS